MKFVIGFSGGMDSATLLGSLLSDGHEVHCCCFQYGSKHNAYERYSTVRILEHYRRIKGYSRKSGNYIITDQVIDLSEVMSGFDSALLKSGGDIPEGHFEHVSMKQTIVPGRNTIFAAVMLGVAESIGADAIALGVHGGDRAIYPDCRLEYIRSLETTLLLASDGKVKVHTPFIDTDKRGILELGMLLKVPYDLTRTCYKDQPIACGRCGSCQERLLAFDAVNIMDPIPYVK